MKIPPVCLLLSLSVLCSVPTVLRAGSTEILPPAGSKEAVPNLVIDLDTQFEFADPSTGGPSGDVWHSGASLPLFLPLSTTWRLIGVLRGGFSDYETAPFDSNGLQTWNVGGLVTLDGQLNDTWSAAFGILGGASWEDGASFSDSLNGGGLVMAGYRISPTLKIGVGALYLTRLNEDALIVPALGLDWQVSDRLEVKLYGLDLKAGYGLSDTWSIFLRGEFDPGGAKLQSRSGTRADSFDDQGFRAAGGVTWKPCTWFNLTMEGGVAFHEYTLRNDREEILAKDRLDPAPFVGVSARLAF